MVRRAVFGVLAVLAVPQIPLAQAEKVAPLGHFVIRRPDLGPGYVTISVQYFHWPTPESGMTWDKRLYAQHGYITTYISKFGHRVPGTRGTPPTVDSLISSSVDQYTTAANAHWALLRERYLYRNSPSISLPKVGDEMAAFGVRSNRGEPWTTITFRRYHYLLFVNGNDLDGSPNRVLSLALLMDAKVTRYGRL